MPGSTSLADYISGIWGALGVMLALRVKERTGRGQFIDIALYESVFRLLDELAPAYAKNFFFVNGVRSKFNLAVFDRRLKKSQSYKRFYL